MLLLPCTVTVVLSLLTHSGICSTLENTQSPAIEQLSMLCPPWIDYDTATKQCTCNELPTYSVKCIDHGHAEVALGWCTTFNDGELLLMRCPYFQIRGYNITSDGYYQLPGNVSQLNDYMCGPMNRRGRVCMYCIDGFGPSYTSLGYECSNCIGHWYGVPLYLLVELVPNILFYLTILIFHISLTSAPMTGYIWYSQIVSWELTDNGAEPAMRIVYRSGNISRYVKVVLSLYGIWNLDYIRYLVPPFCISTNLKMIHIAVLGYISAFYPLCLILLTCVCIELHSRNFRPLVWLWRPFHKCFVKLRKGWDTTNDIINVFASFFFLSFSKLLYQSVTLLSCRHIISGDNSSHQPHVAIVDPTVTCGSKEHLVFAIPGLIILIVYITLLSVFFLLYPTRALQSCLSKCQLGIKLKASLDLFTEKFNSCYRDGCNGGRDLRRFSALYFYLRILAYLYRQLHIDKLSISFWSYRIVLFLFSSVLIALIRPYKKNYMNVLDSLLLALLALQYHFLSKEHSPDQATKLLVTTLMPATGFMCYISFKIASRFCRLKGIKRLMTKYYCRIKTILIVKRVTDESTDHCGEARPLIQPTSSVVECDYGALLHQ